VQVRSKQHDPAEYPWRTLLWPPLVAMFLRITVWGAEAAGHVWNVHSAEFLFPFAFLVSVVLAGPSLRNALGGKVMVKEQFWCRSGGEFRKAFRAARR
jgi:hypothetical protein